MDPVFIPSFGIDLSASALLLVSIIASLIATVVGIKIAFIGVRMAWDYFDSLRVLREDARFALEDEEARDAESFDPYDPSYQEYLRNSSGR